MEEQSAERRPRACLQRRVPVAHNARIDINGNAVVFAVCAAGVRGRPVFAVAAAAAAAPTAAAAAATAVAVATPGGEGNEEEGAIHC